MSKADPMDRLFQALAHPSRRKILDVVKSDPGCSVNDLSAHFEISRIAVMRHLNLLEDAGLIVSEREGRFRRLYFNVVPIQLMYDRWTDEYSSWWAGRMADLKYGIEGPTKKRGVLDSPGEETDD